ncbi:uncharacterized protein BP5553_10627 [Venustampulla echinocandica]|uniref:AB hydrolase-1 domain-containing protein n=1 Tax=Venustampulla echinocandica TaxID=2656787 RepID=A0A370T935_9HELO|nr:uncharacterized protein BP5553_10627 [Venustampulla echinocandica]RDL30000.1 hypothetical protein BP5553_10627 [Venustampulla echinocandica]
MRSTTFLPTFLLPLLASAAAIGPVSLVRHEDFVNHTVTTSDGYQLNLQRLVSGFAGTPQPNKIVYLQHGLFDSSDTWLLNGPENSLAYVLANQGYDVWMGNSRGNQYSPTTNDKFSWDEMAQFDLPAFVSYVLKQTKANKLSLIGHSQGAVEIVASLADGNLPPSQLSGVALLGPPAQLTNQRSKLFAALAKLHTDEVTKRIPSKIFVPTLQFFNSAFGDLDVSYDVLYQFIFGPSKHLADSNFAGHFPAPTSGRNLAHWIQSARTGLFQHYQEGTAPAKIYDLTSIPANTVKVATFVGANDFLATETDVVEYLNPGLQENGNLVSTQTFPGYAHMDFTWAKDAVKTVYPVVLSFLEGL